MSPHDQLKAKSVSELCSLWDEEFVERAYWTILGRAPDPTGKAHYLGQLRTGVSKFTILMRLRESAEGRKSAAQVDGLDGALERHRQAIHPVMGPLIRFFSSREGNGRSERLARALANQVAVVSNSGGGARQGDVGPIKLAAQSQVAMVDHVMMRLVRVEASLKRIEDKLKGAPANLNAGKVARKP